MKVRIVVVAILSAMALVTLGVAPASADPQKGDVLEVHCDELGMFEIVVFSNGRGSPGLVVGSNQVIVPYALRLAGTFTPVEGEPETFGEEWEHPAPRNGRLDHCTFSDSGTDEFGSFVLEGEVWVSYTPAQDA
jgi:hypothetical protein